ncbi:MAG: integral rane sensor hybrid histidine kinase, partial [Frankiales bacterium]|nr:integral rane sensor hybrid histidine kinase [Frankiales bacterium]
EAALREHERAVQARRALEAAHDALVLSEGTLRDVLDAAGDAYLASDEAGVAVAWNAAAEGLLGWTAAEVEGQVLTRLLMPETDRAGYLPRREHYLATGATGTQELHLRHRDGHLLDVEATFWRAGGAEGGWSLHALARDIGPRKEQEAQLAAARDAALAASRAKSLFLANTSHEIRTPLNGVLGMTALLLDGALSPAQRERAELVQRSGRSLLAVIDDVLDLSLVQAGEVVLVDAPFDLGELAAGALAAVQGPAAAGGLVLGLHLGDVPGTVLGDAARLRQVLLGLLGNAVKFTPAGSVALEVQPGEDGVVRFTVRDTGVGIAPEDRERLFEPFAQADASSTRRNGGTGLGLALARDLVRLLGGRLHVDSEPGRGSAFSFALPLAPVLPAARVAVPPGPQRPLRLLLAEDSPLNQVVAVGLLEALGCRVDVVDDGQQALDRLEQDPQYDALLLDCQMPVLDGYDAVRAVRAREQESGTRRLPVVALTASAMAEDRDRCLDAGMDDYFSKPFSPEEVLAALQGLVSA